MARKPAEQTVNRADIISAAADVLSRNGYESSTMKDIAAAVNLTAASLYHHFRNKDALLLAVLETGLDQVIAQIEPITQSNQCSADKLRAMVQVHVVSQTENTAVGAAMVFEIRTLMQAKAPLANADSGDFTAYADFLARRERFFTRRDRFEELFREVLRDGIASGEFFPVDAAIFVKTMLGAHNWVSVWYRPEGRLNGQQIATMMSETFLRGLGISPA